MNKEQKNNIKNKYLKTILKIMKIIKREGKINSCKTYWRRIVGQLNNNVADINKVKKQDFN